MKINDANLKFAYTPGYRSANTELVLHHAAGSGSVEDIHRYHLGLSWAGIAYHFYVRKDGTIWRGRPENWLGGHTENHGNALGICFEGNFDLEIMSEAQKQAGRELVADLLERYSNIKVYKHSALNATACPGMFFPFDAIVYPPSPEPQDTDAEANPDPSEWAKDACEKSVTAGVFVGDGSGNFNWREPVTREQLAVILDRLGLLEGA